MAAAYALGLLSFSLLACASVAIGWPLACRLKLARGAERFVLAAFLGVGLLTLSFGLASYAGLAARPAALVVVVVSGLAIATSWNAMRRTPLAGSWILVALIALMALRAFVDLDPLRRFGVFGLYSDALMYISTSEWLQHRGFDLSAEDLAPLTPDDRVFHMVAEFHAIYHRMGPMFLLALVKATLLGISIAIHYLAVLAWGAALNVAATFLACRWSMRLTPAKSLIGAILAAATLNALTYSVACNFFCQVYGTAALTFGLATLSRITSPARWNGVNACLIGFAFAFQMSVYSELTPVLGIAALATLILAWRRNLPPRHRRRLLRFTALSLALTACAANIELVRAVHGIRFMIGNTGVGWPIGWTPVESVQFVLGLMPRILYFDSTDPQARGMAFAAIAATALVAGLWPHGRRQATPIVAAMLTFAMLASYFAILGVDPWSGARGHTWNLLKICKWAMPVVVVVQAAGFDRLARLTPRPNVTLLVLVVALVPVSFVKARRFTSDMASWQAAQTGPQSTIADLDRLRDWLDAFGPTPVCLMTDPSGVHETRLFHYITLTSQRPDRGRRSHTFDDAEPDAVRVRFSRGPNAGRGPFGIDVMPPR